MIVMWFSVEAGRISPNILEHRTHRWTDPSEPDYMSNPHWWRYRDKHCCHPKNTWHYCCHRETYWNNYVTYGSEENSRSWYNPRGTGFLRCLLLVLMWCLCWPCAGIGYCVYFCYAICYLVFFYEDD